MKGQNTYAYVTCKDGSNTELFIDFFATKGYIFVASNFFIEGIIPSFR